MTTNPFEEIEPPKQDHKPPRIVGAKEQTDLLDWLSKRYHGWRLPILFLEVKARIGCRISELSAARTAELRDGRLHFAADTTKGRKERACKLPAAMYAELKAIAGPTYVFERFAEELRTLYMKSGQRHHAARIRGFSPARLKDWIENQAADYFEKTEAKRFKLHNLRGTAMSRAREAGISYDDAAVAFGCHPETMRRHYVRIDETRVADSVMDAI